jgi:hypothetical protein
MDSKEKADWARHYDILFWTTTTIMSAAIGSFLSYLSSPSQFNPSLVFIVINLITLTVYFGASFRELRFIFQEDQDALTKLLIDKRDFLQWWVFISLFMFLGLICEILLFKNIPSGKFYWITIGIINLIFILFIGSRANGDILRLRIQEIKEKKVVNNLPWQPIIAVLILVETLVFSSYYLEWPLHFILVPILAVLLYCSIFILDKIEKRKIVNLYAYYPRVLFITLYLTISVFLIIIFQDKIFSCDKLNCSRDIYRFIWCLSGSFMGFSLIASQLRFEARLPYGPYIFYYPPILLCISSLIYSIFSTWVITDSYIFYFITFPLCFILAFLVDYFWKIILKLINSIKSISFH